MEKLKFTIEEEIHNVTRSLINISSNNLNIFSKLLKNQNQK